MTLKEALEVICSQTIPKEINGVRTYYVIKEVKVKPFDVTGCNVVIFPKDITNNNLSYSRSFNDESWTVDYEIQPGTIAWEYLDKQIYDLFKCYMKAIIAYFDGKVVETRVCTFNPIKMDYSNYTGSGNPSNVSKPNYEDAHFNGEFD